MISKHLAIAAAIAFLSAFSAGPGFAQQTNNPPAANTPAANAPAQPGANAAPPAAAPAATPPAASAPAPTVTPPTAGGALGGNNPYGLYAFVKNGDFVIRGVVAILAIMSIGTWYIFF
ncbi:MAG: MotA/TolQ/ExbB proton channel family protein, partial [Rhizomicrobium sp.]